MKTSSEIDRRITELAARERAAHADPTVRIRRLRVPSLDEVADALVAHGPMTANECADRLEGTRASVAGQMRDLANETPPRAHRTGQALSSGPGRPQTVWGAGPAPDASVPQPPSRREAERAADALPQVPAGTAVEPKPDVSFTLKTVQATPDEVEVGLRPFMYPAQIGYLEAPSLRDRYFDVLLELCREPACPPHIFDRVERLVDTEAAA